MNRAGQPLPRGLRGWGLGGQLAIGFGALLLGLAAPRLSPAAADVNVLQIVPLTGVQGGVGWQMQVGARVAFDAVNAKGGVHGRRLRLLTLNDDDDGVVERARRHLDGDGAVAVLGLLGGGTFDALWRAQLPQSQRVPVIGVQSGAHSVQRIKDPLMTLTRAGADEELDHVMRHLATVRMRRVAYVGDDDADGRWLAQAAREKAAGFGVELVAVALHAPHTAEVAGAVDGILKTPHQAVVIASNTAAVALFSKLYKKSQGSGQVVALSSAEATQLALVVGSEAARGVMISQVVPNPRNPRIALMREFMADYASHGPADLEPTLTMTEAYINARLLALALQSGGADAGRQAVARFLAARGSVELSGLRLALRPEGGARFTGMSVIDARGRVLY